jgi:hypothetical protein
LSLRRERRIACRKDRSVRSRSDDNRIRDQLRAFAGIDGVA